MFLSCRRRPNLKGILAMMVIVIIKICVQTHCLSLSPNPFYLFINWGGHWWMSENINFLSYKEDGTWKIKVDDKDGYLHAWVGT